MSTMSTLDAVKAQLDKERFLDLPVGEYNIHTLGGNIRLGTAVTLREHYHANLSTEDGRIVIGERVITATPAVLAVLRAVLLTGCCYIEGRAQACRSVFIRACSAGNHIDTATLLSTFEEEPTNKFCDVIQKTIKELVKDSV